MHLIHRSYFIFLPKPSKVFIASKLQLIKGEEDFPWYSSESSVTRLCVPGARQRFPLQPKMQKKLEESGHTGDRTRTFVETESVRLITTVRRR